MKHFAFNDSDVLREFDRLVGESDSLTKTAQTVAAPPLTEEEKGKLQHFLGELQTQPSNGPGMERWVNRLKGTSDPYLKRVHDALAQRYQLWAQGKDAQEVASVLLPSPLDQDMAAAPSPASQPTAGLGVLPKGASNVVEVFEKTADQKCYDVTGEEDMIDKAHPKPALVEGDLVENENEQQEADKEVATKSAKAKRALTALYELAKHLKAEGNDEAYDMVKKTCLDIAVTLKK